MKLNWTKLIICSVAFVGAFVFASDAKAAYWVNDPNDCPTNNGSGFVCAPPPADNIICGSTNWACSAASAITAPASSVSGTAAQYSASFPSGGYIMDCYATRDSAAPYCNNNGALWCNASSTCYGKHVATMCYANKWAGDSGASECDLGTCLSGYADCNGGTDGCEVQIGVTSCTVGGLSGTYDGSCTCQVAAQHFITGVDAEYATANPLLWGTQYGAGDLINIAKNGVVSSTFVISNSGQMGIGLTAVSAAAAMEVSSTDKGALLPRLTTAQRNSIAGTPDGLIIYNIDSHRFEYYNSASSSWQGMGEGGAGNTYTAGDGLSLVGNEFRIRINSTLTTSTGILGLATSGATPGTYGTGIEVPVLTVDTYGRITSIGTTTIYISSSQLTDSSTIAYLNKNQTFVGQNTFGNTTTFNSSTIMNGQLMIGTTTATSALKIKIAGRAGASYYCDENGENCFDPKQGWATPSITEVNTTTYTTDGDFSTSTYAGYQAANYICASEYPGSHFCETDEILGVIRSQDISFFGTGNIDGAWIAEGPPGFTANANDCNGWTNNTDTRYGPFWIFDSVGGGMGWLAPCTAAKPLSCCK